MMNAETEMKPTSIAERNVPCENNASCLGHRLRAVVLDGQCVAQPTCDDGQANGSETDIDCGGADCPPCDLNESCGEGEIV